MLTYCQLDPKEQIQWNLFYPVILLFICLSRCIKFEWIELELKENELNWNWIERFWLRFELELNWIGKSWTHLELELKWIERNELIRVLIIRPGSLWYPTLFLTMYQKHLRTKSNSSSSISTLIYTSIVFPRTIRVWNILPEATSPSSRPSIISDNAPAAVIRSHAHRATQLKVITTYHDWAALTTHLWSSLSIIMWMEDEGLPSTWPTNLACTSCNADSLCCNAVFYCMGQFPDLLLIFSLKLIPDHLQR